MTRIPQFGAITMAAALIALPVMAQTTNAPPASTTTTPPTMGATPAPATNGAGSMSTNGSSASGNSAATSNATGTGTAATTGTGGAASTNAGSAGAGQPANSGNNTAIADTGEVRASKVIGSSVYNDQNDKIGSIDDILMGRDEKATTAVISVGGFLGIGSKLVAVPYSQLKLTGDNKVTMPGASKDALNNMPTFQYHGDNASSANKG